MKASELFKKSVELKDIYEQISILNKSNQFKIFYPHFTYVSDEVKLQLIKDGFKVYEGEFLRGDYGLLIEW